MDNKYLKISVLTLVPFLLIAIFSIAKVFSDEIRLNPILLNFGVVQITWYAFLICIGMLLATLIGESRAKKEKVNIDEFYSLVIFGIIFGVIGARLYYVLFNLDYFLADPIHIFFIFEGGLAIHGGILGGILSTFVFLKVKKNSTIKFLQATDFFTLVVPLAQAIGRWGNFFNYEAYGKPTSLPWKMYIPLENRFFDFRNFEYYHPTFLYESFFNLLLFIFLLWYVDNKRKSFGEITFLYMIFYFSFRSILEMLRLDNLMLGDYRINVIMSILIAIFSLFMFFKMKKSFKGGKSN